MGIRPPGGPPEDCCEELELRIECLERQLESLQSQLGQLNQRVEIIERD